MSQAIGVQLQGVLVGGPAASGLYSCGLTEVLPIAFCDTYTGQQDGTLSNLVSSDVSPYAVPFGTVTKARVIAFKLLAGATFKLNIVTALGTATIPVSDQFLLRVRNPGDEVLSMSISTGSQACDIAYAVFGDVS